MRPSCVHDSLVPKLTETTQIRELASGKHLAVFEPGQRATILSADSPEVIDSCGWLVEDRGWDYERIERPCGARVVLFDNGWLCTNGHDHYTYGTFEYFDDDEIEAARLSGAPLPANARSMAGARVG